MDSTLTQILAELYQAHRTIDVLNVRIAELEAERSSRNGRTEIADGVTAEPV